MIQNYLLMLGQGKQGGGFEPIFLLGFVAILYFFMMRPQAKKQKELKAFSANLKEGDKIVTIGGIHGKITKINADTSIQIECDRNTTMTIESSSVSLDMTQAMRKRNS
jgi:preprotein translocase subunit YajC